MCGTRLTTLTFYSRRIQIASRNETQDIFFSKQTEFLITMSPDRIKGMTTFRVLHLSIGQTAAVSMRCAGTKLG